MYIMKNGINSIVFFVLFTVCLYSFFFPSFYSPFPLPCQSHTMHNHSTLPFHNTPPPPPLYHCITGTYKAFTSTFSSALHRWLHKHLRYIAFLTYIFNTSIIRPWPPGVSLSARKYSLSNISKTRKWS